MQEYLADTWFFIALTNRFDSHYAVAHAMAGRRYRIVTHDAVLTEVLSYASAGGAHNRQRAVDTVRRALREFTVEHVSRELFHLALDLYGARRDKEYSLVDCVSMVLMRQRGITDVLTNDHHFRQEGFTVVDQ
jgi:predicted nucleic acid-binding protein